MSAAIASVVPCGNPVDASVRGKPASHSLRFWADLPDSHHTDCMTRLLTVGSSFRATRLHIAADPTMHRKPTSVPPSIDDGPPPPASMPGGGGGASMWPPARHRWKRN
eukprot:scaffold1319_cov64-Phaeocystis_antarctica.AAC.9